MHFVELIIQGVRQFPELRRLRFGPGYNGVLSPVDGRAEVLLKALSAVLYNSALDGRRPELVEPGATSCRVGLTLVGRDGKTYRLLRDFVSGAVSLSQDGGDGQFKTLSSSAQAVSQLLGAQVGWPAEDVYSNLLLCRLAQMPSRQAPSSLAPPTSSPPGAVPLGAVAPGYPGAVPPGYPGAVPPGAVSPGYPGAVPPGYPSAVPPGAVDPSRAAFGMPGQDLGGWQQGAVPGAPGMSLSMGGTQQALRPDPFPYLDSAQKKAKLAELKSQLELSNNVKRLEFELDGLQRRKFELDDLMRPFKDAQREVDETKAELAAFADIQDISVEFPQQLAWFAEQKKSRDSKLQGLEELHQKELANLRSAPVLPLSKDPMFLGGLGLGVVSLGLGLGLARLVAENLWVIALLDIPAFGVVAWSLLQRIAEAEKSGRGDRVEQRNSDRRNKVISRFELDTTEVRKVLQRHNIDSDNEDSIESLEISLDQRAQKYERIHAAEAALREVAAQWERDPQTIIDEHEGLNGKVTKIEDQLAASGGVAVDMSELQEQIIALESLLGTPGESSVPNTSPLAASAQNPTPPLSAAQTETVVDGAPMTAQTETVVAGAPVPMTAQSSTETVGYGVPVPMTAQSSTETVGYGAPVPMTAQTATVVDGAPVPMTAQTATVVDGAPVPMTAPSSTETVIGDPIPSSPPSASVPRSKTHPTGTPVRSQASAENDDDTGAGYGSGYGGGSQGNNGGSGGAPPHQAADLSYANFSMWASDDDDGFGYPQDAAEAGGYGNPSESSSPGMSNPTVVSDLTRQVVLIASELFGGSIEALGQRISARLGQYLGAFTEQRLTGAQFDERGGVQAVEAQSGRAIPFLMLAPADRDIVFFSLKFVVLEAYAEIHPLPALLEDPFVVLPDLKHPLALKLLQFLASRTQVIHLTSLPALAPEDTRVAL